MILPTKRINQERALLAVGAEVLRILNEPKTVSRLWEDLRQSKPVRTDISSITFDWFVLALDLLYIMNTIELERGKIRRVEQ